MTGRLGNYWKEGEVSVHLSFCQLLQHSVSNASSTTQMSTETKYNTMCTSQVFNKQFNYLK